MAASRGSFEAGLETRRSSTGSTMPWPKKLAQIRLAIERVK
jgi:hypothetical protein